MPARLGGTVLQMHESMSLGGVTTSTSSSSTVAATATSDASAASCAAAGTIADRRSSLAAAVTPPHGPRKAAKSNAREMVPAGGQAAWSLECYDHLPLLPRGCAGVEGAFASRDSTPRPEGLQTPPSGTGAGRHGSSQQRSKASQAAQGTCLTQSGRGRPPPPVPRDALDQRSVADLQSADHESTDHWSIDHWSVDQFMGGDVATQWCARGHQRRPSLGAECTPGGGGMQPGAGGPPLASPVSAPAEERQDQTLSSMALAETLHGGAGVLLGLGVNGATGDLHDALNAAAANAETVKAAPVAGAGSAIAAPPGSYRSVMLEPMPPGAGTERCVERWGCSSPQSPFIGIDGRYTGRRVAPSAAHLRTVSRAAASRTEKLQRSLDTKSAEMRRAHQRAFLAAM